MRNPNEVKPNEVKKVSDLKNRFEAAAQAHGAQAAQDSARRPAPPTLPRPTAAIPANSRTSDVGLNNNGVSQRTEAVVALASRTSGALDGLAQDREAIAARNRLTRLDEEVAKRFQTKAALTQTFTPSSSSAAVPVATTAPRAPVVSSSSSAVPVAPLATPAPVTSSSSSAVGGSRLSVPVDCTADEELARSFQTQAALTHYARASSSPSAVPAAPIAPPAPVTSSSSSSSSTVGGSRLSAPVGRPAAAVTNQEIKEREEKNHAEVTAQEAAEEAARDGAAILRQYPALQQAVRATSTSSASSSASSRPRQAPVQAQDNTIAIATLMSLISDDLPLLTILDPSYAAHLDPEVAATLKPLRVFSLNQIQALIKTVTDEDAIFAQGARARAGRTGQGGTPRS